MKNEFISIKFKDKEFRIYKWEDKPFKDFPMPKGFEWCEYSDFDEMINSKKIKLEKYPIYYYCKNQFKLNIERGYFLSRLYLYGYLDMYSGDVSLASSDGVGRVVVSRRIK